MGCQNSNFLTTLIRHEIFRIDKCKSKIKHDKIWGYHNEGVPLKRGHQNSNFLNTFEMHEIFRIGKYEEKIKFDQIGGTKMKESFSNKDAKIQL